MSVLEFHTRDKLPPYGKPSVYFTAHPADAETYLQELENDIFLLQDCVVWFDPEADRNMDDSFFSDLSYMKMQLLVIPVTRKLLTEPNRVTGRELPFALAQQIPVLPIMMERGLEPFYEPVFGDLQFLSKVTQDATAISYEEKLRKFLDSVLVGSETTRRIQDAFDALIFLSYRKKDRSLANELMDLVHRIPELLAVGIWYDEFLVPGEGFNGGIRDAIGRSDLVVLTVTPNLVNEDNFIRKTEYRWAYVDYKKDVLPVQMAETDLLLLQCFQDLAVPVDPHNEEAFRHALLRGLQGKLTEGNRDPVGKYLLGLAYLHGVEMETNRAIGRELITQAAEEGLLEAKEKLAQMYFHGYGVTRDYNAAIRWQKEVVEAYAQRYRQEPSEETWFKYTWEMSFLGDDLVQMRRWDEAIPIFEKTAKLLEEQLAKKETLKYRERLAYVYRELALAYKQQNNSDTAIENLEKAVETAGSAPDPSALLRHYHVQALCDLGIFHQQAGRSDKALPLCEESLQLAQKLLEEDDSNGMLHILSRISYHLAELYAGYGQAEKAEFNYKMALYLMGKLSTGVTTVEEQEFFGECLRSAGEFYERIEKYNDAHALYTNSLAVFETIQEIYNTEHLQLRHQQALQDLETLQIRLDGKLGSKRPRFVKAADDRKTLDPSLQNRTDLADANLAWAKACSLGGNHEKAKARFGVAIDLYRTILDETGKPEIACSLAASQVDLVEALCKAGQWESMPQLLAAAKELCTEALKEKDLPELRRELARAHTYLGRFYKHLGGQFYQTALTCYQEALPLWKQLAEETNHFHMRLFCCDCKTNMAECYLHMDGTEAKDAACSYSGEALEEMLDLYNATSSQDATMCLKQCYLNRAMALLGCNRRKDALSCFTSIYELLPRLADQYDAQEYQNQCAQTLCFMGDLTPGAQGIRYLKEARSTMEKLCQKNPFNSEYKNALELILHALKHH